MKTFSPLKYLHWMLASLKDFSFSLLAVGCFFVLQALCFGGLIKGKIAGISVGPFFNNGMNIHA